MPYEEDISKSACHFVMSVGLKLAPP